MEHTVEDTIKALRHCNANGGCSDCPFEGKGGCSNELLENAAKLLEKAYKPCEMVDGVPNPDSNSVNIMLDEGAIMPTRAHETDAGLDLYAPCDFLIPASLKDRKLNIVNIGNTAIDTGVHIELAPHTVGMIKSKSGLNVNHGLTAEGVIDEGYTGSICVKLYNHTDTGFFFKKGDKIAQLVILPILTPTPRIVDKFKTTDRGDNGFGSTGK